MTEPLIALSIIIFTVTYVGIVLAWEWRTKRIERTGQPAHERLHNG